MCAPRRSDCNSRRNLGGSGRYRRPRRPGRRTGTLAAPRNVDAGHCGLTEPRRLIRFDSTNFARFTWPRRALRRAPWLQLLLHASACSSRFSFSFFFTLKTCRFSARRLGVVQGRDVAWSSLSQARTSARPPHGRRAPCFCATATARHGRRVGENRADARNPVDS